MWAHALGIVASFAISLGIALLSWRFIEEPVLRLKARGEPVMPLEAAGKSGGSETAASLPSRGARGLRGKRTASDVG